MKRWYVRFRNKDTQEHVVIVSTWAVDQEEATKRATNKLLWQAEMEWDVPSLEAYEWALY